MRRDEYKRQQVNDIPQKVLPVFEKTMKRLGFNPDEFLDEKGNWIVDIVNSRPELKYVASSVIRKDRLHAYIRNTMFRHIVSYGRRHLNRLFNTLEGDYYSRSMLSGVVELYLSKFVEYDKIKSKRIEQSRLSKWWNGVKREYYRDGWTDETKNIVERTIMQAEAHYILCDIIDFSNSTSGKCINHKKWREHIRNLSELYSTDYNELDSVQQIPRPFIASPPRIIVKNGDKRFVVYKEYVDINDEEVIKTNEIDVLIDIPAFSFYFDADEPCDVRNILELPILNKSILSIE